ncbi:nuclear transport factor 2 family protein [Microbacterium sp. NEAU-LLC]|uniref:Nuclear transport factor 2 family protein n=1 Tax=Microbacterium helvum TaxID=2773713 RepID=A0ABR8NNB7_9MICO|nr:nuclear transport factor 2 family protein [Microbacterium helvum]MBD3942129.1 nuclear transport factor 2 family protein [Microbacterium helvum]
MIDAIEAWKRSGEAGDAATAVAALTPDAELISPLTERFRFRGRDEIEPLLRTVLAVIDDYRYVAEAHADEHVFLTATFSVAGTQVEEFQHLELAPDGRIARLALAMRPLPALTAFARALGPALATAQGDARAARTLRFAGAFLDSVAATGDRRFIPLAAPR